MSVDKEFVKEGSRLKRLYSSISHSFHPFFGKPLLVKKFRAAKRAVALASLLHLAQAGMAFADVHDVLKGFLGLYDELEKGRITEEQAANRLPHLIHDLDKHVQETIEKKSFHSALGELHVMELFATALDDRSTAKKLFRAQDAIRHGVSEHIDLRKTGVFTDHSKNHLYIIGSLRISDYSKMHSDGHKKAKELLLDIDNLHTHFFDEGLKSSWSKMSLVDFAPLNNHVEGDTLYFVYSVRAIILDKKNILPGIASNLASHHLFVPFK